MRPSKTFATAGILFVLGASGVVYTPPVTPVTHCTSDDGSGPIGCVWDAQTQGNGVGTSFVSVSAQISDVAQTVTVEDAAQKTIDQLSALFPNVQVYWTFAPDPTAQYWGLTYCTNTDTDPTPVVILDNDVTHFTAEQLANDIPSLVRHEFGHVLMCNAGLDSEPSTEKEDVAEAIGQLLTPANESRIAFYLDNSALSSAEWAEARNVIAGSL